MNKIQEDSINFIKDDVIPEMIYNRCFCERGSREFVEFESINVEPLTISEVKYYCELYRAQVGIKFSGELKIFCIIIKLLPCDAHQNEEAYGRFRNEELFYNKIIVQYQMDIYPKCYVADMGRYGRPIVVLEDLEAIGYSRISTSLDEDHLKLCLTAIAKFHANGIKLKQNKFEKLREFYSNIIEINSQVIDSNLSINESEEFSFENIIKNLNEPTICHGEFNINHLVFQYEESKPVVVKIFGWNQIKYTLPIIDLKTILNNNTMTKNSEYENEIVSIKKIECIQNFIDFYYVTYVKALNAFEEK